MTQPETHDSPAERSVFSRFSTMLPRTLAVLLAAALQVMPMLRAVLPAMTQGYAPSTWAIVLKLATGAVALFGYHAVSSASSLSTPAAATVGTAYVGSATYSGGHAAEVLSWQVNTNWQSASVACATSYAVAPGLTLQMSAVKYIATITGTPTQAGTYGVKITLRNTVCTGNDQSDVQYITITVNGSGSAPAFTTMPTNQTVTVGGTATFAAAASGTPAPGFYWKSNNVVITGANTATFSKSNVQLSDAATYMVVATNSSGTASNSAVLTVIAPPNNQAGVVGTNVTFAASASSPQPLTYRWQFKGVDIAGATNATFTTNNIQSASAGTYTVIVSNAVAAATYSATLTVTAAPPNIVTAPAAIAVTAGQPANFTVSAGGTAPLAYQWQKNGANISGAAATNYSIAQTRLADAGNFTVVITNAGGSITSAVAALTVNNPLPPPPSAAPVPQAGKFLFTFTPVVGLTNTVLTNANPAAAGWGVLTNVPPPATTSSITVTDAAAGPSQFYRVMVVP